jgi:hypothetical protein
MVMTTNTPHYPPPPPPQNRPDPQSSWTQARSFDQQVVQQPSAFWPLTIISFLCSFLLGGIAMYFSAQVGNRWKVGDVVGARKASQVALILGIIGIAIGLIVILGTLGSA